jgi:hypothetical protein
MLALATASAVSAKVTVRACVLGVTCSNLVDLPTDATTDGAANTVIDTVATTTAACRPLNGLNGVIPQTYFCGAGVGPDSGYLVNAPDVLIEHARNADGHGLNLLHVRTGAQLPIIAWPGIQFIDAQLSVQP